MLVGPGGEKYEIPEIYAGISAGELEKQVKDLTKQRDLVYDDSELVRSRIDELFKTKQETEEALEKAKRGLAKSPPLDEIEKARRSYLKAHDMLAKSDSDISPQKRNKLKRQERDKRDLYLTWKEVREKAEQVVSDATETIAMTEASMRNLTEWVKQYQSVIDRLTSAINVRQYRLDTMTGADTRASRQELLDEAGISSDDIKDAEYVHVHQDAVGTVNIYVGSDSDHIHHVLDPNGRTVYDRQLGAPHGRHNFVGLGRFEMPARLAI